MDVQPHEREADPDRGERPVHVSPRVADFTSETQTKLSKQTRRFFGRFELPLAMIAIAGVMSAIQFAGPAILDNDGYYHIRWASLLRQNFPHLPEFKALPLTTLDEQHYADHHYLFHVLLFPFTLGDLRVGAKVAAVFFSTIGIASVYGLLISYRVRWRWIWLAPLIASSEPFLYRMSTTRAPALSLMFLAVGTYLILNRRLIPLALLSFVFVWSYSLFPLVVVFACAYSITVYLSERRIDLWPPLVSLLGVLGGLVINPYFPKNLGLFREHLMMKLTGDYPVDVGVEWYTYEAFYMLTSSLIAFAIFFAALLAFEYRDRLRDKKPLFLLIVSVVLLLMSIKSRRFMEYFPPLAVLFGAVTITPKLQRLDYSWLVRTRDKLIAAVTASLVVVFSGVLLCTMVFLARAEIAEETSPYAYKGASRYIAEHAPPGSMVFNTNWDTFPALYFYNPDYAYVAGLDPSYLYDRDHELWKTYESITNGDEENAASLIRDRFGAEYVVTGNGDSDFLTNARDDSDFEIVYEDKDAVVLRVRGPQEPRPRGEDDDKQQ
jgi:hypothetical protein